MEQVPKYAQIEHERRFLVTRPPDLSGLAFRIIEDLYISSTRMRLRTIIHSDHRPTEFKLCKKYPQEAPKSCAIVNVYLTAREHALFSQLPGRPIRKRRYHLAFAETTFAIDVFEDELSDLMLCEVETTSVKGLESIPLPSWAGHEVTADPFFRGGNLACVSATDLKAKLAAMQQIGGKAGNFM